jgi:hypothetical protein
MVLMMSQLQKNIANHDSPIDFDKTEFDCNIEMELYSKSYV